MTRKRLNNKKILVLEAPQQAGSPVPGIVIGILLAILLIAIVLAVLYRKGYIGNISSRLFSTNHITVSNVITAFHFLRCDAYIYTIYMLNLLFVFEGGPHGLRSSQ